MYQKAESVLPPQLIQEIQHYCQGIILYIPKAADRAKWGSKSGTKKVLEKRNQKIKERFSKGEGIDYLAEEFFLSPSSIKKIVYAKK